MDFRNVYAQGFARVAACTLPVALADPATNAERVIADGHARATTRASPSRSSPSCRCRGYAIDDLLLQDVLLDAVDDAVVTHRRGHRQAAARRRRRRPAAPRQPALQLRRRHPPRRGARRRAEVVPAQLPRVLREAALRLGRRPPGRVPRASRTGPAPTSTARSPSGPTCLHAGGRARPRGARRDLRGHVGAGAAEPRGRARRRDRPAQPLGIPHHRRPRRGPPPARPLGERPLQRRLPVRRRERG